MTCRPKQIITNKMYLVFGFVFKIFANVILTIVFLLFRDVLW